MDVLLFWLERQTCIFMGRENLVCKRHASNDTKKKRLNENWNSLPALLLSEANISVDSKMYTTLYTNYNNENTFAHEIFNWLSIYHRNFCCCCCCWFGEVLKSQWKRTCVNAMRNAKTTKNICICIGRRDYYNYSVLRKLYIEPFELCRLF